MICNNRCYYAKGNVCKCVCNGDNHGIGYKKTKSSCEHQWDEIEPIECIKCGIHKEETMEEMIERTKQLITEGNQQINKIRIKKARTKVTFQTLDKFVNNLKNGGNL